MARRGGLTVGRRPKNIEKFMRSLDEYTASNSLGYTVRQGIRAFDDELFVFCESSGGRLRHTADDYYVIGGRGNRKKLSSAHFLADALCLNAREKRKLCSCLESGKSIAVISAGDKVAVIYCGLLGFCGLGVACLTSYPPTLISAVKNEKYSYLFGNFCFWSEYDGEEPWGDLEGFVNKILSFEREMLKVCGKGGGYDDICGMISATASIVGCGLLLGDTVNMKAEDIDRDTLSSILLCLFSSIRLVSTDRRAAVRFGTVDGDDVITVKFNTKPSLIERNAVFIDFCRSFCEHYLIPFAYEIRDTEVWISFIPSRIDPSVGGFKASIYFDMGKGNFTVKRRFDDAH